MEDNSKKRLLDLTGLETAEFEKMAEILLKKRSAISSLDTERLQTLVSEELSRMNEIRVLEKERAEILRTLSLSGEELVEPASLDGKLGSEYAGKFLELHGKFRAVFANVMRLNDMCQVLLLHSLAFIKQNIRILTDDGKRRLVDKKA
jgi:hypothetical protein